MQEVISTGISAVVGPDKRTVFKQTVLPYAQKAREQLKILGDFKKLDSDLQAAKDLMFDSSDEEQELLTQWVDEINKERQSIGGEGARELAQDTFRQSVNSLRSAYDNWRIEKKLASGEITPLTAMGVTRPQIPPAILGRREHQSPPRLHHGLGNLPTHREHLAISADVRSALAQESVRRWPQDEEARKIAQNVLSLFPEGYLRGSRPSAFRRPGDLSQAVVEVTDLLINYSEGKIISPKARELGQPSAEQESHIIAGIRIILLHELFQELTKPAVTEGDFLQRIQKNISSNINQLGELIGNNGFDLIAKAIDSLPDVEAALLRSRLSISEDINLGFPRADLAHEKRFAEMLNWAVYDPGNRVRVEVEGRKLWVLGDDAVNLILEKLQDRVETGDIDLEGVIAPIQSLAYGERLLEEVFTATHDDGKSFLISIMSDSGLFDDLRRKFEHMIGYGEEDYEESDSLDYGEYLLEHEVS